jgi:hypothetical protein
MNDRQAILRLEYAKLWIERQGEEGENNSIPGKFRALVALKEVIEYLQEG